jgi:ESX secretion system ATPase EccB
VPSVAPPSPATRDQVDAYRFALRRWEAALVRGDPVPLHEQVRAQRRAVAAGVVLGVLGLAAALVSAVVAPRPVWRTQDLVVGTPSGALYVVAHDPDRLVPVANAVAGRLVLAALRSAPVLTDPVLVDDGTLAEAPRSATAGVAGAVGVDPRRHVVPRWAVCDEVTPTGRLLGTTVFAGVAVGSEEPAGVVLAVPGGATWLVTGGHRHRVDLGDTAVRTALGLTGRVARPASPGLVSALPEGSPLVRPVVPGAGAPGPRGVRARVGDVVSSRPAGAAPRYHVVLDAGLQEVSPLVADVLAAVSGKAVTGIGQEVLAGLPPVRRLDVAGWPTVAPMLREPAEAPVTCWTWSGEPGADPVGGVHIGRMPGAEPTVALAGADGAGARVDAVAVGAGGAVRATAPGVPGGAGTVWLVSASGVANGVADEASAAALGITDPAPAPEAALRLLPAGPVLDVADATEAADVPVR